MAIEETPDAGIPEWVVTFGDMMSLLLTFFIILLSMSEMKEEDAKFQAMVEAMREQFGHDLTAASVPGNRPPRNSNLSKIASMGRSARKDTRQGGAKVKAPVGENQTPLVIRPGDRTPSGIFLVFDEHTTELTEKHKRDLQYAVEMFAGKPQKIEIRGHTSRRPPPQGTLFELGYRRATVVMDHLVDDLAFDIERIAVSSAGPNEPIHKGTDLLEQRKNSRVEVYMLNKTVKDMSGTPGDAKETDNLFDIQK